ncbi:MAG TPA: FGGY family carbohydrate kinase [Candidatus Limnocylindrales bacterium]|nr:FGGY family carbohydrate kinase [Candidatus Limnocylindrales bacterium]
MLVIGCDVGTQSTKAILVDAEGTTIGRSSATYPLTHPAPGWADQDPGDWLTAVGAVISDVVAQSGARSPEITGIGVAAQVDGIVAVDRANQPLAPALIWMDRRAVGELAEIEERVSSERIRAITGANADPSHGAPKIAWLRGHLPAPADAWLTPAGFVVAALTGRRTIDPTNASSLLLLDLEEGTWSPELLEALRVDAAALGELLPSTAVAGGLRPDLAAAWGVAPDVSVVVGSGDEHAACVAAGVLAPGLIGDITGTAEPVAAAATRPVRDPDGLVETHRHVAPDRWLVEHPGFVSAGSVRWLAEDVLGVEQAAIGGLAGDAPVGAGGVRFLPALGGAMTPRWNPAVQGAFTGLAIGHDRRHLARALLEGCAFAVGDVVDRLETLGLGGDTIRVVGGGARDRTWLQIKADVTGRRIERLCEPEATALGAALTAAVGLGWFPDLQTAATATLRLDPAVIEPHAPSVDTYREIRAEAHALFDALEAVAARDGRDAGGTAS